MSDEDKKDPGLFRSDLNRAGRVGDWERTMWRRIKSTWVDRTMILSVLTGRAVVLGIPEDADIVNVTWGHVTDALELIICHPSFPVVPDGELVPRLETHGYRFTPERMKAVTAMLTEDKLVEDLNRVVDVGIVTGQGIGGKGTV